MTEKIKALLVQARPHPLDTLRLGLEEQSLEISTASSCAEAVMTLWSDCPPQIVFTDIQLADGKWTDVLTLASRAAAPVNVIVVAPFADVKFYVQTIERGAFDFVVPPLSQPELQHVVRIAAENAFSRRPRHAKVLADSLLATSQAEPVESQVS